MGCPPVRKIIHSLKLVDYLHVQADNPWYNCYLSGEADPFRQFVVLMVDNCYQGLHYSLSSIYSPCVMISTIKTTNSNQIKYLQYIEKIGVTLHQTWR